MQGITNGTILDVFDKLGEKIGTAKVLGVLADKSIVSVAAKRAVTTEDRAVIVSQDFGGLRLRVLLDGDEAAKLTADNKKLIQTLRQKFTPTKKGANDSHGVDLAIGKWNAPTKNWDVALLKDAFGKVFPDKSRAAPIEIGQDSSRRSVYEKFPSDDAQIFYLANRDFAPLYGFYVEADKDYTERTIEKALLQLARLRSIKAIANKKSPLYGKITITPYRLIAPSCKNGQIVADKKEPETLNAAKNLYKFNAGEPFWLEVINDSKQDLYIVLLNIGTDGSVKVLFPGKTDVQKSEGVKLAANGGRQIILGEKCQDNVLATLPPAGTENFKLLATTKQTGRRNFEFLEMESLNAKSRGEETSLLSVGDWTTAEINFEITMPKE